MTRREWELIIAGLLLLIELVRDNMHAAALAQGGVLTEEQWKSLEARLQAAKDEFTVAVDEAKIHEGETG